MFTGKPKTILVCLVFLVTSLVAEASAQVWDFRQAALGERQEDLASPPTAPPTSPTTATKPKPIRKVKPAAEIVKCRPAYGVIPTRGAALPFGFVTNCVLPISRPKGWELDAEGMFARTKGKARLIRGTFGAVPFGGEDVDFNSDMQLPDHNVVGTFSVRYRFMPQWSLRYSIMPTMFEGSGQPSRNFAWGTTTQTGFGQTVRTKWERLYQRIGMVYDPIRSYSSRVSVFADYVRINEKVSVLQNISFAGSDTFDNDLNMGMAGVEFEQCLRTGRKCNTLSLECKAGVAFGDEAFGTDLSTGLKYSIAMNNGRWGYVRGGYRYLTYKKSYSDVKMIDTAMEGGYLALGVVF
jgi:hypothetical protein